MVMMFNISLHEVRPWPTVTLPPVVMIQWQRGEKRAGHTKCIVGSKDRIILNELLTIPATLYKLPNNKSGSPRYQKKCIVFSLCEASEQGIPRGLPLGRAVLDFADYGNLKEQRKNAFSTIPVAVGRKEFSSLGTPHLSFTISPHGIESSSRSNNCLDDGNEDHASPSASLDDEDEDNPLTDEDDQEHVDEKEVCVSSDTSVVVPAPDTFPPVEATPPSITNDRVQRILTSPIENPFFTSSSSSFSCAAAAAAAAVVPRKTFTSITGRKDQLDVQKGKLISELRPDDVYKVVNKLTKPKNVDNVLQAAREKYAEGAAERTGRLEKKALEEATRRADAAEAKATAAQMEAEKLQSEIANLKSELCEAAAIELALYSAVAQHGSSSQKIHAPARRLARLYIHACNNSTHHTKASTARTCASGLVVVVRACENDISRLTFWWSNVAVLRTMVAQITTTAAPSSGSRDLHNWCETSTLVSTLERIEAWIFGRIVECIWWQSLTPHMQSSAAVPGQANMVSTPRSAVSRLKKSMRGLMATSPEDSCQGLFSIEIWKAAFLDALQRICPVRAGGHDCGCLQIVARMTIEQCIARLDVAMFNAILRDTKEDISTDPISDPIMDFAVLPIQPDGVSFGGGVRLKNVINTWSTWLLALTASGRATAPAAQETVEIYFTLLRTLSDLLMLPKDMLMDKSVRKEVCPALSLLLIRRILSKFIPDEYASEPVSPSLLAALNAEISMERQRVGEEEITPGTVIMASAPPVVYFPPPTAYIHDTLTGKSQSLVRSASICRKGHNSDDELEELESPLFLLVENGCVDNEAVHLTLEGAAERYRLLRAIWN